MANRCRQRLLILLAVILVLSIAVPLVMAEDEVTWYWKDTNASGFNLPGWHKSDKLMDKITPQGDTDSIVTLGPDGRAWWYADKAAEESLIFLAGDWSVTFWAETNSPDDEKVYSRVCKVYADGTKTYIGSSSYYEAINSSEGIKRITENINGPETGLQQGDRIAVEILFSGAESGEWLKIYYESSSHNSRLVSPPNSPHYPAQSNRSPVLVPIGDKTVDEGSLLEFMISASDPDGDPLTYSASNLPTGAVFDITTRKFSWHPDYTRSGTYPNVHFEVSDGSLTDSEDITITVNNVNRPPPPPTLLVPPDGLYTNDQTPTFDWTDVTDPDGDPVTYDLQVDDNSDFSSLEMNLSGLASSEYTPGFNLDEGTHYWHARSSDGSDTSDWTLAWTVTIDITPPTIIYSYPTAGGETSWYNSDPGNVIDIDFGWIANSPLDYAQWRIGEGTWNDIFTADQSSDYTTNWGITWASLAEGENQISIRVADKAGNFATHLYVASTSGFLYRKDTGAPSSAITSPADGANLNSLTSIDGTASDPGSSGMQKVEVSIKRSSDDKYWDGSSWVETQTWLQAIGTTAWSYAWTPDVDGSYTVRSKATDTAGNVETPGAENTFNFDTTPPGNVTNFTAMPGDTLVSLSWTNPSDPDFKGTMVRYRTDDTYPTDETDGTPVCDSTASPGSLDSFTHTGLTNGTTYYYTAFPYDTVSNYSSVAASAQDSATPAAVAPGDILINEVAFDETNDWIEFYVLKAASYKDLRIYEGGSEVKGFPAITASAGDYIVLHFKGDPANDESDATGKGPNGYWDIYTGDIGLTGTDNVVRIQRVGTESVHETDTIDAVIWSNNNGNFTGNKTVANDLVAADHWDTGAAFSSTRDSDAWTDSDDVSAGKSIGRDVSSTDTNSKTDWYLFTSQTPGVANPTMGTPGDVLINEVAPKEGKDWIEFYNTSGESLNIQYWLVKERSTVVKTFLSYTIAPGEYIVLNFGGNPADDEVAGDANGNGYRDFYTSDSGLTGTDNVIILEDGASTMIDAMAFANNDGTWANPQRSAFNDIVNAGHWEGTPNGGAGINEPESADWSEGDEGRSLGRDSSSSDTNAKADWYLFTSQTPGEANPALGVPGSVLINEVAPSEDNDWIELYNTSAGNVDIEYWVVKARNSVVKTFPSYIMTPGEYIVLNFDGNPTDDETAGDTNGNGYRDFYTAEGGLIATDNVIILEDGASTMIDALAFADNDGTWANPQQSAFNAIVEAGHWEGTPDGGAEVNEAESADWSEGDEGKSLGRDSPSAALRRSSGQGSGHSSSSDTNAKADWYLFTSQTPGEANPVLGNSGDVLINEAAPSEDKDWIEFYSASRESINIQYWLVKERSTVVKTFPAYTVGPGEYFVLNFDGDPADDEIAGDTNGNGYRDFYTADSGLTGTDNVIILEDGASTMIDALAFANNNGAWAGAQQTAFNIIVEAGHWEGTVDGGAAVNEPECADWSDGAKSKSLGRDARSKDTGRKNDWYLLLQTKGQVNPDWPHSVTVTADPASIPADGASTSTIRAAVKDSNDNSVADGTTVAFATDLGALSDTTAETVDGVATVTLGAGTVPGKATVTAKSLRASGQVSVQFTFIPTQIGTRIQLPVVDNEFGWETLIQVQNAGYEDTGVIVFFWGEYSGQCPNNDPGPIGVACMRVPENAVWTLRSQIPSSARSAIVYSVEEDLFAEACEDAADAVGDGEEWKDWGDDYKGTGEPVAVIVQRQGPNDYGTVVSSAYVGISEGMEGSGPPYQYFAPYAMRQYHGLDTEMIIQNSGQMCTSVWLHYQKQGGSCNFSHSEHIEQLAPGESIRKRVPEVMGVEWLGSIYVRANEPLGIIVDQTSLPPSEDRGVLLTYRARPYKLTMDTLFYADLVFRELGGWDASIQVQNLTQESLSTFVTVEFFDASGDSILLLGDWVCPAGGATFYLPAIAALGVEYAGAAVIQSHSQVGYPGAQETEGQPIFAVVDLKKAGMEMDAQGGSYNAYAESEKVGASVIVLPFLARDYQGVTSLIAVRNNSNCNDVKLKLEVKDETGAVVSFVGNFWLRAGHVKLIDLASMDSVVPGFVGAGIVEVTDVQQLCDTDGDGEVDQEPLMPSVVVVNKGAGPGDVTSVYEGIPAK